MGDALEVSELSNADLLAAFDGARSDLETAATTEKDSEWHQACFAAVFMYATEMGKRGLKCQTVH